jgi:glucokinase
MKNIFGIFVGTGIGGGLIIDGKLYEGSSFMAGEIGHIPMVVDGPLCGCGKRGCLESVAGRLSIVRTISEAVQKGEKTALIMEKNGDIMSIKSNAIAQAWISKDPLTVRTLKNAAFYIGRAVAIVISILNPDAVILGGGLIEALDNAFFQQVIKSTEMHTLPTMLKETKIVRALLGDDAGVIGAAFYARDCLSRNETYLPKNP